MEEPGVGVAAAPRAPKMHPVEVEFASKDLDRLETDPAFTAGLPQDVVRAFRKRMQFIRGAVDERDLRNWKSNRFKKLKGDRAHQHSMRLNDQWRLILEIRDADPKNIVVVVSVEDYH